MMDPYNMKEMDAARESIHARYPKGHHGWTSKYDSACHGLRLHGIAQGEPGPLFFTGGTRVEALGLFEAMVSVSPEARGAVKMDAKDMDRNEGARLTLHPTKKDPIQMSIEAIDRADKRDAERRINDALDGAEAVPSDIHATLAERGSRYGDFREQARVSQAIKTAYRDSDNWDKLDPYQREALEMNAHKVARILCGDPNYDDSWRDLVGYHQLVLDRLPKGDAK